MSNVGVHVAHCCSRHGCKYCDDYCPVMNGEAVQAYPCEDCSHEDKRLDAAMRKAVALGVMQDSPQTRQALMAILIASDDA